MIWKMMNALQNFEWGKEIYLHSQKHFKFQTGLAVISEAKPREQKPFCTLLKRFAYPCRYSDMVPRFARPVPVLSMITNEVLDYIYTVHSHRIMNWNRTVLNPPALQIYAQVISQKGSPLQNCFGFVDGTVRTIARPDNNQKVVYNGHKWVHTL